MFYRQFLKITNVIPKEFVEDFDFWLATLPENDAQSISVETIASRFEVMYSIAEAMVLFAFSENILIRRYMIICDNENCQMPYSNVTGDELIDLMNKELFCHNCDHDFLVTENNTMVIYKRAKMPNVSEEEIRKEIFKRLKFDLYETNSHINFNSADLLGNNVTEVYNLYYSPDESAYEELKKLRIDLDLDYGKNTTKKGAAYEKLALRLFEHVKTFSGTNKIHTFTNQFDCTIRCPQTTIYESVFQKLSPYFTVECKNEKNTPSNTYYHKLSDILSTNEAQVGIVFSRVDPSNECMTIAREQFLLNRNLPIQRYLVGFGNSDLEALIENRVNLLEYLEFKIMQMTTNARNATYEMFLKEKINM